MNTIDTPSYLNLECMVDHTSKLICTWDQRYVDTVRFLSQFASSEFLKLKMLGWIKCVVSPKKASCEFFAVQEAWRETEITEVIWNAS